MTSRTGLVERVGEISRLLHARGLVNGTASGGIRRVAGRLANQGDYRYRNRSGHVVTADLSDYMERIGFFGAHSARLIRFIRSRLRPGDWAIDVGANVGLLTSPMSAAVGRHGSVWAIEPWPANIARLRDLRDSNDLRQLEIFPLALSAAATTARLRQSTLPGGGGSGSFVAPWGRPDYLEVPTVPLDQLVRDRAPHRPLRVVKIDVEGFEAEVLAGAEQTLTTMRPLIVCEFHDALLRAAGSSSELLLHRFAEYGYAPLAPFGRPPGPLDGKLVDMVLTTTLDART